MSKTAILPDVSCVTEILKLRHTCVMIWVWFKELRIMSTKN